MARVLLLAAAGALAPASVDAPVPARAKPRIEPAREEARAERVIALREEDLLAEALRVGFASPVARPGEAAPLAPERAQPPLALAPPRALDALAFRGGAPRAVAEPPRALLLALSLACASAASRGRRRCLRPHPHR